MKKTTVAVILLLASLNNTIHAQTSSEEAPKSYVGDINKMFPAAPTSNNLMKFEEVPVSYYTGIPDISIPLISIPTINSKVTISVGLKYHPLNAKPDDRSGETGLGWSLLAGGTISRTVRGGNPDEKNRTIAFSTPPKSKFGIYFETNNPTVKLIRDQTVDLNNYTFDAAMGKFDTEYDLYQYNFMGQAGRFYVVKDEAGNYKAEKLDKNNLQITMGADTQGIINSFTITDDKGMKYIFTAMEKSQKSLTSIKIGLTTGNPYISPSFEIADYWTSFHLTSILDQNNVLLASFVYDLIAPVKYEETPTNMRRIAKNIHYVNNSQNETGGVQQNPDGSMPGSSETQYTHNNSTTRLLTSITVTGKGTISLNYEKGREDTNYTEPSELYKLKSIQSNYIGQSAQQYTDKYIFDYGYSNTSFQPKFDAAKTLKKLLLTKVTKVTPDNQNQEYTLDYNTSASTLSKDGWGYYTGSLDGGFKSDVLKSMTYPTKGKAVFDFGLNSYSHYYSGNSMVQVAGHTETLTNTENVNFGVFSSSNKKYFFTVNTAQNVHLHMTLGNLIYFNWTFKIYKKNNDNTFTQVYQFGYAQQACNRPQPPACVVSNPNPDGQIIPEFDANTYLQPGVYYASLEGNYSTSLQDDTMDNFEATTTESIFIDEKIRSGGGLRINNISYFSDSASGIPAKKYAYDYKDINDPQRSSGSLVFPQPALVGLDSYAYRNRYNNASITYNADFDIITDYNIFPTEKTQGSDVGYKYVTVTQLDKDGNSKGRTVHTFRSPLDFPNQGDLIPVLPVIPIPNLDYLRGQQVSEKTYNEAGQLLSETATDYITTEFEKNDGIKLRDNFSNNMVAEYYSFSSYQDMVNHIGTGVALTTPYKSYEKFGVTLPSNKQEIYYFYNNGVQSSITSTTSTNYNSDDYPILVTKSTQGDTYTSSYKYAKEKSNQKLINANMIGIPLETETKKNGQTKKRTETLYADPVYLLPSSILSYGLTGAAYTELTYEKYDQFGNLQQFRTKDGIPTSIVWGYNNSQPIAKIEGIDYNTLTQVAGSQITAAISASDTEASAAPGASEETLLSALQAIKTAVAAYTTLVTTFTYDPLIGVRSITQPTGTIELYYYDSANRLKEIKQRDANASPGTEKTVREFQYNYKN